jgi:hypothetical protein
MHVERSVPSYIKVDRLGGGGALSRRTSTSILGQLRVIHVEAANRSPLNSGANRRILRKPILARSER